MQILNIYINIIRIHMYFVCKIHYEALLIICTAYKNKTRRYVWFRLCIKILHIIRCFGKNVLCNPLFSIKKKIYIITCNIPFNNSDDIFSRINWWGNMIYVYCCCEVSAIVCYGSGRIWIGIHIYSDWLDSRKSENKKTDRTLYSL